MNCLLYADDLLLLSETKEGLQSCLNSLKLYCNRWKLNVNLKKTKVIVFSKGKKDIKKFKFFYDNEEIEIVEEYKYLGIIVYFNGNFKHAADHLYNQSMKALFTLYYKVFEFNNIDYNLKLKLFDTLIRPISTYGAEIWISDYNIKESNIDKLPFEKIQNKFCKSILGVHKKSSNSAVKCELERQPILNHIEMLTLKYYERLKELPSDRLLSEVYKLDKSLHTDGHRSWYKFIENTLNKYKFTDDNLNLKNLKEEIRKQFTKYILQKIKCLSTIESDNKLHFYSNIYSNEFEIQSYLSYKIPNIITRNLTKLRISSHPLLIEKGRYFRPKLERENRLCFNCYEIEDEKHLLVKCNKFNDKRKQLFDQFGIKDLCPDNTMRVINSLMNPQNANETKHICKYIKQCFEIL